MTYETGNPSLLKYSRKEILVKSDLTNEHKKINIGSRRALACLPETLCWKLGMCPIFPACQLSSNLIERDLFHFI